MSNTVDSLLVVLYGQHVGTLTADSRGEASFTYRLASALPACATTRWNGPC